MLVLGLGLGMVMQVLVLAVQNAVDYRNLGVATSGTTLFRSTGGSVGVSLFGAIFAGGLASGLAGKLPAGAALPSATDTAAIAALPPAVRSVYLEVFTQALHPVFLSAAVIAAFAFLLSWLLEEVPLRDARAETIGESFAMPRDATSIEELSVIVERLATRDERWQTMTRIANRAGVAIAPDAMWLLAQVCRAGEPLSAAELAERFAIPLDRVSEIADRLATDGLLLRLPGEVLMPTDSGHETLERLSAAYRERLYRFAERWAPEHRADVTALFQQMARDLIAELPTEPRVTA